MSNEEIRKLMGGFATGNLTDAERRRLFEASLDDQDLFEELMREQELKSLLELPGAKPRLIRAVEPRKRRMWWVWGTAAGVVAASLLVWLVPRTTEPEPVQLAKVEQVVPEQTPAEIAVERAEEQAAQVPEPQEEAPRLRQAPAPRAAPPPAAEPVAPVQLAEPQPVPPPKPLAVKAPPPPKAITPAATEARADQEKAAKSEAETQVAGAPQNQLPVLELGRAGGRAGAFGGVVQGQPPAPPQAQTQILADTAALAEQFGVSYALVGRSLRLTPLVPGYLFVSLRTAAGPLTIFPRNQVVPGVPIVLNVPDRTEDITVTFAASLAIPASEPQPVTEPTGTITGPDSREIRFVIPVTAAPPAPAQQ